MPHPLELSYQWQTPVVVATVGFVLCEGLLLHGRPPGWLSAAVVLALCWAGFLAVVWLRCRAFCLVEASVLVVRRFRSFHRIEGATVLKVAESLGPSGASYRLTVREGEGRVARYTVPTALLRKGHSTLFTWILTWAPQAELDRGSRRTLEHLQHRGLVFPLAAEPPPRRDDGNIGPGRTVSPL